MSRRVSNKLVVKQIAAIARQGTALTGSLLESRRYRRALRALSAQRCRSCTLGRLSGSGPSTTLTRLTELGICHTRTVR